MTDRLRLDEETRRRGLAQIEAIRRQLGGRVDVVDESPADVSPTSVWPITARSDATPVTPPLDEAGWAERRWLR